MTAAQPRAWTAGPYRVAEDDYYSHATIIKAGDYVVGGVEWRNTEPDAESNATAALWAAAPDLYEALSLCQRTLALLVAPEAIKASTVINAYAQCVEADTAARAALAKATTQE